MKVRIQITCYLMLLLLPLLPSEDATATPGKSKNCIHITPGKGIGPFRLGMDQKQVQSLQKQNAPLRSKIGRHGLQMENGRLVSITAKLGQKSCFRIQKRQLHPKDAWFSLAAQIGRCQRVQKNRGGEVIQCRSLGLRLSRSPRDPKTVYLTVSSITPSSNKEHCSHYLHKGKGIVAAHNNKSATRHSPAVHTVSPNQTVCHPAFVLTSNSKPNTIPTMGQCEQYKKKGKHVVFCNHEGLAFVFNNTTNRLQQIELYHQSLLPLPTQYPPPSAKHSINKKLLKRLALSQRLWRTQASKKSFKHYRYTRSTQSYSGYESRTTIEVKQGRVVARNFKAWMVDGNGKQTRKEAWTEKGKEVGKHQNGAPPKSLTSLYTDCSKILKTKSKKIHVIRVAYDKQGILKTCTYREKGCQDDCTSGFSIHPLTFITHQK